MHVALLVSVHQVSEEHVMTAARGIVTLEQAEPASCLPQPVFWLLQSLHIRLGQPVPQYIGQAH